MAGFARLFKFTPVGIAVAVLANAELHALVARGAAWCVGLVALFAS